MPPVRTLSKADARRALASFHFTPAADQAEVYERLRSVQFDPIAPVGCNHDLVFQARLKGYKVGDWQKLAYEDRTVYDGWDKQACLVPFEGWPWRRYFYQLKANRSQRIFDTHPEAAKAILEEIAEKGPLMPRDSSVKERHEAWEGSWYGGGVAKQILRAMWHAGIVMTAGRKGGNHLYDLTERVVPPHLYSLPLQPEEDSIRDLVMERHRAVGIVRPTAAPEMWSYVVSAGPRKKALDELIDRGELLPVEVEGVKAHATPSLLSQLDQPPLEKRVVFVAPLDQILWDRKMIQQVFDFDYSWEIYTPEVKRRWGYYVLPVLYGDRFVARVEFWSRKGVLEIRQWHFEEGEVDPSFFPALEAALRAFMQYCSATEVQVQPHIDTRIRDLALSVSRA